MSHPDPHNDPENTHPVRHFKSKALKKRTDGKVSAIDANKAYDSMSKRFYKRLNKS